MWSKRWLWIGTGLVALSLAIWKGAPIAYLALTTVSTNDAYVNGHVTFVAARVKGQVAEVLVDNNNVVRKGDVLVRLDPEPNRIEVQVRQASLDVMESKLIQARADARALEATARAQRFRVDLAEDNVRNLVQALQASVSALRKNEAAAQVGQTEYERIRKLVPSGSATREELDERRGTMLETRAAVRSAQDVVRQSRAALGLPFEPPTGKEPGFVPDDWIEKHPSVRAALAELIQSIATLGLELPPFDESPRLWLERFRKLDPEGDVDRLLRKIADDAPGTRVARANRDQAARDLDQAKLDLTYCTVVAEIDGVVSRRNVNPGNNVVPGLALMAVRSTSEIWIDANFKETQLEHLRIGQAVELYADAYGDRLYKGRISGFSSGTGSTLSLLPPENATGNFVKVVQRLPVRIELDDPNPADAPLFIGLSVVPFVRIQETPTGPNAGQKLQRPLILPQGPGTRP